MQVRALKSFAGKYGHIRVGQRFNCEPHYANDLIRNGLVDLVGADDKPTPRDPGPAANRSIPEAPARAQTPRKSPAGKDGATANTGRTPAAGVATQSRSLRQDLASRGKTSKPSESGDPPSSSQDDQPGAS